MSTTLSSRTVWGFVSFGGVVLDDAGSDLVCLSVPGQSRVRSGDVREGRRTNSNSLGFEVQGGRTRLRTGGVVGDEIRTVVDART